MIRTLNVVHNFLSSVPSTKSEKYSENGDKSVFSKFATGEAGLLFYADHMKVVMF